MREVLSSVVSVAVLTFAASSMASVGFGHDWRDIVGPLRERWLTMLLPLVLGLVARVYARPLAVRLQPVMSRLSTVALLVMIPAQLASNLPAILAIFATSAIVAALIVVGGAFLIGYALGGPTRESKEVLGLGTAQRNIAAATVVATQAINDPDSVSMVIVTSLTGSAILFPAAVVMRRRKWPQATSWARPKRTSPGDTRCA